MNEKRTAEEMKDYTALLLNCFIKQKKFEKLKEFVDKKNINEQPIDIETAIEVCKDTQQIDLALAIARKSNMTDFTIQILLDMRGDCAEALDFLKREKSIAKSFNLFMKYGEKFLSKIPRETLPEIKKCIEKIILFKNKKLDEQLSENDQKSLMDIKYESIITIFINQGQQLEKLLDFIMEKDEDPPATIIHRRIELYLDQINSHGIFDKIKKLLLDKKYKKDLDYLFMIFKNHTSTYNSELISL